MQPRREFTLHTMSMCVILLFVTHAMLIIPTTCRQHFLVQFTKTEKNKLPTDTDTTTTTTTTPQDVSGVTTHYDVTSALQCARLCSDDDPTCVGFQFVTATETMTTNASIDNGTPRRQCRLFPVNLERKTIPTETEGIHGYQKFFLKNHGFRVDPSNDSPFILQSGVFLRKSMTPHGLGAVYDCHEADPKMTLLTLLYDYEKNEWPNLNAICSATICKMTGVSNTFLEIKQSQDGTSSYPAHVRCTQGETHHSDVTCDGDSGVWSYSGGELKVGCISSNCYRTNGERAIYSGTVSKTSSGIQCQRWDSQSPHDHSKVHFEVDDDDPTKAANFCRDADYEQRTWCYTIDPDIRWKYCSVPVC